MNKGKVAMFIKRHPLSFILFLLYIVVNLRFLLMIDELVFYLIFLLLPLIIFFSGWKIWNNFEDEYILFNPISIFFAMIGTSLVAIIMIYSISFPCPGGPCPAPPPYLLFISILGGFGWGYLLGSLSFYIESKEIGVPLKLFFGILMAAICIGLSILFFVWIG